MDCLYLGNMFGMKDLDSDLISDKQTVRTIDRTHASGANLRLDALLRIGQCQI